MYLPASQPASQPARQPARHADRQTDRHTDRHTDRGTDTDVRAHARARAHAHAHAPLQRQRRIHIQIRALIEPLLPSSSVPQSLPDSPLLRPRGARGPCQGGGHEHLGLLKEGSQGVLRIEGVFFPSHLAWTSPHCSVSSDMSDLYRPSHASNPT